LLGSRKYLEINTTNSEFVQKLSSVISSKIPFCLTRFGDGEITHLNEKVPKNWIDYYNRSWGFEEASEGLNEIDKILKKALKYSDAIGVLDPNNEVSKLIGYDHDIWALPKKYLSHSDEKIVVDHQICRSNELGNPNNLKNIISGSSVCLISPNSEKLKSSGLEKILETRINFLFSPEGINLKEREKFLKVFDTIKEDIVIYGCSIRGKDFGVLLKERGKIALDFGSTLDAWSGLITRKWFEPGNIQAHCLIKTNQ
jgi:hypothetical protein